MKLVFKGIVQGVGFRPTIYRIAKKMGLKGYVLNTGSEVEVVIDKKKDEFINYLKKQLPNIAKITDIVEIPDSRVFKDFKILKSSSGEKRSLIPNDVATCDNCINELFDKDDRRYLFPFTNCTVCGARYSVIEDVPYDRERTSMKDFPLCEKCKKEYNDPLNRRYHAQTISCPICGPKYFVYDKKAKKIKTNNPIQFFAEKIDDGFFGVIKSWGGMHLCCNTNEIKRLRKWYKRPQKAFAIMFKNIDVAKKYTEIGSYEEKLLRSNSAPIVLVKKKKLEDASPGLNTLGVFLPYSSTHHILFSYMKSDSIVMTSANIPGEAMITDNKKALSLNADYYLLHNRDIPNRVDDSVVKTWNNNTFFIRRSRGYVPEPIPVDYDNKILCVGPGDNITGTISSNKNIYQTQYIGKSKYYSSLEFLEESLNHIMNLFMDKKEIDAVGMDMHPGYDSRVVASRFSEEYDASLFEVQHHHAHAAGLMLENNLDEIVVLSLDGLGYGDDGNFWGGEILFSTFKDYKRLGHLEYIPMLGGDMATIDPRRLVFAIFKKFGKEMFFQDNEAEILSKLMDKSPMSSSMGRVLDALSCYLGICCKRTYDGETAMKLEKYLEKGKDNYPFNADNKNGVVETIDIFRQLDEKIKKPLSEKQKSDISYSFIKTIIDSMVDIAIDYAHDNDVKNIGISGGVSYNIPIVEMTNDKLKKHGFELVVHNKIPNGDGGISVGQNVIVNTKI